VSKSCADLIAQSYASTYELPVCITRCGNFFGGGDLNWNRLVPGTLRDVYAGRRPVIRSDGSFVRDYLYVEDGAAAYICVAEALMREPGYAGRAFNFSLESPLTVLEMLDEIQKAAGTNLPPVVLGEATHEIPAQYLDSSVAKTELGWKPGFGLEEGLRRTATWYREHLSETK
jgi:CDP-glucose 4,6-dehydratase